MLEGLGLGLGFEILEALGHAVKAEGGEQVEGGMGEHGGFSSVEVAGAAQVGVVDDGLRLGGGGRAVEAVGEDGGDALVGERTDREGAGRDRFGACRFEIAEQPQDAEAGSEALLGMRAVGQDGRDQAFGVRADRERAQRRKRSGVQSA